MTTTQGARPRGAESRLQRLTAHYAPGQERPLRPYAALAGIFAGAVGGSAVALRAAGRPLPERPSPEDILLMGIATHKLSRLLAKDKVTSFLRAPFTRFVESSGQGEVEEEPYGSGMQLAVGELVLCPYCLAQWVAAGLAIGFVANPRLTRTAATVYVAHTISDFLQVAYRAAEEKA